MQNLNYFLNKLYSYFNWIIGIVGGFFCYALGGYDKALGALIGMVVIDYITGLLSAYMTKKLNSDIGRRGIVKKVGIFIVVVIAYMTDIMLNAKGAIRLIIICFYISKEGVSALENLADSGVPIPAKLQDSLEQLNKESNRQNKRR